MGTEYWLLLLQIFRLFCRTSLQIVGVRVFIRILDKSYSSTFTQYIVNICRKSGAQVCRGFTDTWESQYAVTLQLLPGSAYSPDWPHIWDSAGSSLRLLWCDVSPFQIIIDVKTRACFRCILDIGPWACSLYCWSVPLSPPHIWTVDTAIRLVLQICMICW